MIEHLHGRLQRRPHPQPHSEAGPKPEYQTEKVISVLLRVGVTSSLAFVVAGVVLAFTRHPAYRTSSVLRHEVIEGHLVFPHSLRALFSGLASGNGQALIIFGLALLLATPFARVIVSIFTFIYEKDRTFVVITIFVLSVLIISLLLGKAGA